MQAWHAVCHCKETVHQAKVSQVTWTRHFSKTHCAQWQTCLQARGLSFELSSQFRITSTGWHACWQKKNTTSQTDPPLTCSHVKQNKGVGKSNTCHGEQPKKDKESASVGFTPLKVTSCVVVQRSGLGGHQCCNGQPDCTCSNKCQMWSGQLLQQKHVQKRRWSLVQGGKLRWMVPAD